jgi:hypothetical protein
MFLGSLLGVRSASCSGSTSRPCAIGSVETLARLSPDSINGFVERGAGAAATGKRAAAAGECFGVQIKVAVVADRIGWPSFTVDDPASRRARRALRTDRCDDLEVDLTSYVDDDIRRLARGGEANHQASFTKRALDEQEAKDGVFPEPPRAVALFDAHRHKTIATLRADGSPRISGIEAAFENAELAFGPPHTLRKPRLGLLDVSPRRHGPTIAPAAEESARRAEQSLSATGRRRA